MMEYTMKLIFTKETDMAVMEKKIKAICQRVGSVILEINDNVIVYGAEIYEKFGPAFMLLTFDEDIKRHIVDIIWTDSDEGSHSCKKQLLKEVT